MLTPDPPVTTATVMECSRHLRAGRLQGRDNGARSVWSAFRGRTVVAETYSQLEAVRLAGAIENGAAL